MTTLSEVLADFEKTLADATAVGAAAVVVDCNKGIADTKALIAQSANYTVPDYQELAFSDNPVAGGGGATFRSSSNTYNSSYTPGFYVGCMGSAVNGLHWKNIGGDWKDANGTAQGTVALASQNVTVGAARNIAFDVTATVKLWTGGAANYGFILVASSGTGTISFSTRLGTNPPTLVLTSTSKGQITAPCGRSQWLTTSQIGPTYGSTYAHVTMGLDSLILWFDLSSTPADITAATLNVYSLGQFGAGATISVYEVWNPGDQSDIDAEKLGVAANYANDSNLGADPSILFAERFDDANYVSRFSAAGIPGTYVTAPDAFGFTPLVGTKGAVMCYIKPGDPAGGYLDLAWSPWRNAGLHSKPLSSHTELYSRHYVMLGTDWGPNPDGGKMPGWDGRYFGFATSGVNGPVAGMGNGNGGTGCDGHTGFSVRGAFERGTIGTADPLANGGWLSYGDVYNLDQPGDIGTGNQSFGNQADWSKHYMGWLRRGQWYCIDQYLKLNSVTVEAPQSVSSITSIAHPSMAGCLLCTATLTNPDTVMQSGDFKWIAGATPAEYNNQGGTFSKSTNNGRVSGMHCAVRITVIDSTHFSYVINTSGVLLPSPATGTITAQQNVANRDGITRVWVNGHLAHEKTNWGFVSDTVCRDGTTPYGIDYWWGNVYFGGTDQVQSGGHVYFGSMAVGTSYIGPIMSGTLPLWLQGQPLNQWVSIPGGQMATATDTSFNLLVNAGYLKSDYTMVTGKGYGTKTHGGGIYDYSGGSIITSGSEMLVWGGGGAGAWAGNEARGLRLEDDAPTWKVKFEPALPTKLWPLSQGPVTGHSYMQDGVTPNTRHSYMTPVFINGANRLMLFGCGPTWEWDTPPAANVDVDGMSFGTFAWDAPGTYLACPELRGSGTWWTVKHPNNEIVYFAVADAVYAFNYQNPQASQWSVVCKHSTQPSVPSSATGYAIAGVDSKRDKIVRLGTLSAYGYGTIDLTTSVYTVATLMDSVGGVGHGGVVDIIVGTLKQSGSGVPGPIYDPVLDQFLIFLDDGNIYTLTYVSDSQWYADKLSLTGTAPVVAGSSVHSSGAHCAIWSRMQYVPNLNGVCILQAYNKPAYFVKTS